MTRTGDDNSSESKYVHLILSPRIELTLSRSTSTLSDSEETTEAVHQDSGVSATGSGNNGKKAPAQDQNRSNTAADSGSDTRSHDPATEHENNTASSTGNAVRVPSFLPFSNLNGVYFRRRLLVIRLLLRRLLARTLAKSWSID